MRECLRSPGAGKAGIESGQEEREKRARRQSGGKKREKKRLRSDFTKEIHPGSARARHLRRVTGVIRAAGRRRR